jgi:hypothetical protein
MTCAVRHPLALPFRLPSLLAASVALASTLAAAGCNTGSSTKAAGAEPSTNTQAGDAPAKAREPETAGASKGAAAEGVLRLGSAIEAASSAVALADVAKSPDAYVGKTFTTTGTVSAVCQHMGCWMEIKDDASAAHIKMAGHAFFVPKTASGRKARVLATLVKADAPQAACESEGHEGMAAAGGGAGGKGTGKGNAKGCKAEAESQLGRPLAKLELVAQGVELL